MRLGRLDPLCAIVPAMVQGELRIKDTDLAARLGFAQPRDIRQLIARHGTALSKMGQLPKINEVVGKGQKTEPYYLNRKQAIFITAKSETPEATDITIEIIHRFDAYERGVSAPQAALIPAPQGVSKADAGQQIAAITGRRFDALETQIRELREMLRRALDALAAGVRFRRVMQIKYLPYTMGVLYAHSGCIYVVRFVGRFALTFREFLGIYAYRPGTRWNADAPPFP